MQKVKKYPPDVKLCRQIKKSQLHNSDALVLEAARVKYSKNCK